LGYLIYFFGGLQESPFLGIRDTFFFHVLPLGFLYSYGDINLKILKCTVK
jgi:hypothetical protein